MAPVGLVVLALLMVRPASGQTPAAQFDDRLFRVGVQLVTTRSGEFERTDLGVSGRLSWQPVRLIGVEGELALFPSSYPDRPAFSSRRVEGLFGATVGPQLGRLRPFGKVRSGFVRFSEAPAPFPCILIFPPPLACRMAAGHTALAWDLGGGVEWRASERSFVRADVGDRLVRYPAPVFAIDGDGSRRDNPFFGHDLRVAIGAGLRF